ncbi:MAG: nicotinamide-nucleotide amidohydrolase family protein [Lachnospiraceae bacterium]|nr:nicotinamide-nucleotide amidohydrolase family protein [Lachnospiraceae bacterium]
MRERKDSTDEIGDERSKLSTFLKVCGIDHVKAKEKVLSVVGSSKDIDADISEAKSNGVYCYKGITLIRLTAHSTRDLPAKKVLKQPLKDIKAEFGEKIFAIDEDLPLEEVVVDLLKTEGLTITTAESATAGMFASRLVNVAGASQVFKEGFITYSNKAKRKYLGVKKGSLDKFTAVSEQVAKEMAKGACQATKADCSIAITGFAGPESDPNIPVGTVYIGCNLKKNTVVKEYHFTGNRQEIRERAVTEAFALLRRCLLEFFSMVNFGDKRK